MYAKSAETQPRR